MAACTGSHHVSPAMAQSKPSTAAPQRWATASASVLFPDPGGPVTTMSRGPDTPGPSDPAIERGHEAVELPEPDAVAGAGHHAYLEAEVTQPVGFGGGHV